MTKEIESIKKKVLPILKKYNISKAGIFGSYARGEQKKKSDVDILVQMSHHPYDLFDFIRLKIMLEEALGKKVDLVEYPCIRKEIKEYILGDEIPIIR